MARKIQDLDKNAIKRVAVFARVSSDDQAKTKNPEDQLLILKEWAQRRGWDIVTVFTEEGVSGTLKLEDRPEVQRLFREVEANGERPFDAVIYADSSRLARNFAEAVSKASRLRDAGVLVGFADRGDVADVEQQVDQIMFSVNSAAAQDYIRVMTAQRARGRYGKAMAGYWSSGVAPYGWVAESNETGNRVLAVDEQAAMVIRDAYLLVIQGMSGTKVAQELNARHDFTPRRKDSAAGWSSGHVSKWLGFGSEPDQAERSMAYYGAGVLKMIRPTPNEEPRPVRIPAPAIISQEQWRKARAAYERNRLASAQAANRDNWDSHFYALSGRCFHEEPDGRLESLVGVTRPETQLRTLACSTSRTRWKQRHPDLEPCTGFGLHPTKGTPKKSLHAAVLEAVAIARLTEALRDGDALQELTRLRGDATEAAEGVSEQSTELLRDKLRKARDKHARLEQSFIQGRIDETQRDEWAADIDAELADITARLELAQSVAEQEAMFSATVDQLLTMTVGVEDITPGSRSETFTDPETGWDIVETPGWADALNSLALSARTVLNGNAADLPPYAQRWLEATSQALDMQVIIRDTGGEAPDAEFRGSVPLGKPLRIQRSATGAPDRVQGRTAA